MKKLIALALAAVMALSMVACGGGETGGETTTTAGKVAIITGTVSQGEEDFQAAEKMKAKYPDRVITATYPDNFDKETETIISNVVALVSDPDVKVLVFQQAIGGARAAIDAAKEINPDLLVLLGVAAEEPNIIAPVADVIVGTDGIRTGTTIPQQAAKLGAKTLIHYSFPRHLANMSTAERVELMKAECAKLGIEFVMADAPDPLSDVGLAGAQQFMLEDVPKMVEKYGKDTAFFATNCGLQEPMLKKVLELGAIYPQPCCPSPYHAFPNVLGIEIPEEKAGDVAYCIEQVTAKIAELGMTGRTSTWTCPMNMAYIEGLCEYGLDWIDAGCPADQRFVPEKISECIGEAAGANVTYRAQVLDGITYENILVFLGDYVTF
ncbi:MAG: DUF3798 domain-containing protein [Oscillospiraceae bacterium]|nr:DUF3798 domain-containing protein [Oscillospiraceae bacterium]